MSTTDEFSSLFAPEPQVQATSTAGQVAAWKVLLVDDEDDIHAVLHMALKDILVEGRPLQLLDAKSAAEAKALLGEHPDLSLILLDVVMETELAGLALVQHIRRDICNRMVQIVLVTGQPGYAPQREVVSDYEINGYRLKSELTADKIYVSVYAALRTYRALRDLERQRVEMESLTLDLREREGRLRSVVETAADAIVQADAGGNIIGWNEGATRIFGYSTDEVLGKSLNYLMPSRHWNAHHTAMTLLQAGAKPNLLGKIVELTASNKRGAEFPVELVLGSWDTPTGPHYSAIIRDISDRKRTEMGLRLAASVYANSYEGIVVTNADKTIIDINPAFTRITGYSHDEVVGQTPKLLSSGRHDASFYRRMWESIVDHGFWQGEVCNRRKTASCTQRFFRCRWFAITTVLCSTTSASFQTSACSRPTKKNCTELPTTINSQAYPIAGSSQTDWRRHWHTLGVPSARWLFAFLTSMVSKPSMTGLVMPAETGCWLRLPNVCKAYCAPMTPWRDWAGMNLSYC